MRMVESITKSVLVKIKSTYQEKSSYLSQQMIVISDVGRADEMKTQEIKY